MNESSLDGLETLSALDQLFVKQNVETTEGK